MSLSRTEKMANAMQFLDANILIRHLTNDDPVKAPACFALIEAIERGEVSVWTSDLIISEVVFVLSSKKLYNLDRETIRDLLLPIINLPGIKLPSKRVYSTAFDLYTRLNIDYTDAYNAALALNSKRPEVYSYDTHFDRVPGIRRQEP